MAIALVCAATAVGWMKRDVISGEIEQRLNQRKLAQAVAASNPSQLRELLENSEPELRRTAAVRLAQLADDSGRALLVASLYPQNVFALSGGSLEGQLRQGTTVTAGQELGRIGGQALRSPIGGQLHRYYEPQAGGYQLGHRVVEIVPAEASVLESIGAIGLVGKQSDAEELESLARAYPQYSDAVKAACLKIRARRK